MKKKTMSVLVAGGAGFLGSHLCEALLSEGARVICLDNLQTGQKCNLSHLANEPRLEFIEADIVRRLPKMPALDRIYNLACAASPPHYQADPEHTMLTCVMGTDNLLRLAERAGARLLLASTSEIYGDPDIHPQVETYRGNVNPIGPRACYDEGKRAAETLCFDFARSGRASVRVARIFNTYGPRMRPDDGRVISNVICQALSGKAITIYGDGRQTRSFCYVADLVDGLMRLMEHKGQIDRPVNLGNPAELTIKQLVARVVDMTNTVSDIVVKPLPVDDPRRRRPDISQARELLKWVPRTDLEQGLKATIAWFARDIEASPRLVVGQARVAAI
jgi:UDP-glucuronate decarboxylase